MGRTTFCLNYHSLFFCPLYFQTKEAGERFNKTHLKFYVSLSEHFLQVNLFLNVFFVLYFQAEEMVERLMNILCCRNDYCRQCFDSVTGKGDKENKKLTKEDIQHPVVLTHQPVTKMDSSASSKTSGRSRLSSSGYYSSPFSPANQNMTSSPVFAFAPLPNITTREHKDSESSSYSTSGALSSSSRKDSSSSVPPDSPASFGGCSIKKGATPVIDMKPIEFWTANRETVQPRPPKRRLPSESEISIDDFNPDIYDDASTHPEDCLTDEQKLNIYKLGQLHFSVQYFINQKVLVVKILEARDLPLPYNQDRQDMARSNPYVKACLLPYHHKDAKQTTVQRKTQSPCWNESLSFDVGFKEVQSRSLEITVKDFDKYSRHCVIGSVQVDLAGVALVKGTHMWKPLQPTRVVSCSLSYLYFLSCILIIVGIDAYKLHCTRSNNVHIVKPVQLINYLYKLLQPTRMVN